MYLSLETLTFIIRTSLPILGQLIELVNSVVIPLFQTTLLKWLTFLLRSLTVVLTFLLFWICLFLLTLVFFLQWLSFHWEILIKLLSQFPLTFHHIHNEMSRFIALLMDILGLIGTVLMFHGKISLNSALLLLLVKFVSGLELMYISLIESIEPHSSP